MNNILKLIAYKYARINKKQWLFYSHNGGYSDNTKALSDAVHKLYPDVEIVWAANQNAKKAIPGYARCVNYDSKAFDFEYSKSKVIIDNVYAGSAEYLIENDITGNLKKTIKLWLKRKNQKTYGLWHGSPLKKMGRDQYGNDDVSGFVCNDLTVITGDKHTANVLNHLTFNKLDCKVLGFARNDVLFLKYDSALLKQRLGLPTDKKVLLYAPTFRNDGKDCEDKNVRRSGVNQINVLDVEKILSACSNKFGGEWVFVCRFHYHVSCQVDWPSISKKFDGTVYNGNMSDDMADYLQVADILLTDYSSAMFDFSLTEKPCFLYADDLENYQNKERGFYFKIYDLPYSLAQNQDELINSIVEFDWEIYKKDVQKMLESLGNCDDGKSSERIARYIYEDVY